MIREFPVSLGRRQFINGTSGCWDEQTGLAAQLPKYRWRAILLRAPGPGIPSIIYCPGQDFSEAVYKRSQTRMRPSPLDSVKYEAIKGNGPRGPAQLPITL